MQPIKPKRLIGEALIQQHLITRNQLEEGLSYQKKVKKLIGEALIDLGYLKEDTLFNFLTGFLYDMDPSIMASRNIFVFDRLSDLITSDFKKWLAFMVKKGASDLHLIADMQPQLRIDGELVAPDLEPLTADAIKSLVYGILTQEEIKSFTENKALDKSFEIPDVSRFRLNLHEQRDSIGVSVRAIPFRVPTFDDLGLPEILKDFIRRPSGLVLVSGPAGTGKSTTIAAMIDYINSVQASNIITIEDPIEYVIKPKKSLIRQRELGRDTLSFKEALKSVVRQDPNIIFLGEMRDLDTMQTALSLAETGHLILSTLHTQDATHAITRIVDLFPVSYQHEIRIRLSLVLQAIVVQQLIARSDQHGRVLAAEVLNCTQPIRNLIRENNLVQIRAYMELGSQAGMKSMNQALVDLYKAGKISLDEATQRSNQKEDFLNLVREQ